MFMFKAKPEILRLPSSSQLMGNRQMSNKRRTRVLPFEHIQSKVLKSNPIGNGSWGAILRWYFLRLNSSCTKTENEMLFNCVIYTCSNYFVDCLGTTVCCFHCCIMPTGNFKWEFYRFTVAHFLCFN